MITRSLPRLRSILLGFILIPINIYFIIHLELIRFDSWPTILALFMNSLFVLFTLSVFNIFLKRKYPKVAFTQGELLTVYLIVNISTVIAGTDYMQVLISLIAYPAQYATPENDWNYLFLSGMPDWLLVKDTTALKAFYLGQSTFFTHSHMVAWIAPLAFWTCFIMLLFWVTLCLNVLLHQQWSERERLTFPLVQIPMIVTGSPQFFRNKMMWLGFAAASFIAVLNGVAYLVPGIPSIPTKGIVIPQASTPPWNAFGPVPIFFYPFAIGIAMLMPIDLSFSCWFFFLFQRMELIASSSTGWGIEGGFPHLLQQSAGALIGICFFSLFNARHYFKTFIRKAFDPSQSPHDIDMPLTYRQLFIGIIFGVTALFIFSYAAGMSFLTTFFYFFLYLALAVGITRLRAELGAPVHDLPFIGPDRFMIDIAGSFRFPRQDLSAMSLYYWFNRSYGSHPMPVQLEGYRLGEKTQLQMRTILVIMLAAAIISILFSFLMMVDSAYRLGASTSKFHGSALLMYGVEPYARLQSWLTVGESPHVTRIAAYVFGLLLTVGLLAIRQQIPALPFHPLGFALAGSWYMNNALWGSIFLGWAAKLVLMRYGGQRAYISFLPFFIGLILADCFWGSIWGILNVVFHIPTYSVWF